MFLFVVRFQSFFCKTKEASLELTKNIFLLNHDPPVLVSFIPVSFLFELLMLAVNFGNPEKIFGMRKIMLFVASKYSSSPNLLKMSITWCCKVQNASMKLNWNSQMQTRKHSPTGVVLEQHIPG